MARPTSEQLSERECAFTRALAAGHTFAAAVKASAIDERHVIRLLDRPDFRPVAAAVLADTVAA
jgi:hypothetical protein